MSDKSSLKEKLQKQLQHWKSELEELNVQLRLGRAEAEDAYEKQKKRFAAWLANAREQLDELEDKSEDYVENLKDRLEKLSNQIVNSEPTDAEGYQRHHHEMGAALSEAESKLAEAREKGSDAAKEVSHDVQDTLTSIRTQLDLFWLKFNLGKADARDEMEDQRKQASHRIQELKHKLDEWEDAAEDRWENFREEMGEAFRHIRQAFRRKG